MKITRSNAPKEKESLLAKVRSNPKEPLKVIPTSILIILPFCICLISAFIFGLSYIRSAAYTYSDNTYKTIVAAIQGGNIYDADGNKEEIPASVQKGIGIDALELQKHVDKFTMNYENGKTELTCSIKVGYFNAVVTAEISSDYTITKMSANYASLGEYMDHLLRVFGSVVLLATLLGFFAAEILIFGGLFLYGFIYNKVEEKKKKEVDASVQPDSVENQLATVTTSTPESKQLEVLDTPKVS